ncbi:MAG: hypothetical protein V4631_03975 [Pseudomonadota bacterium]
MPNPYISKDQAASWQPVKVPFKTKFFPVLQTPDGTLLMQGGLMGPNELHLSKDSGETWSLHGSYVKGRQLLPLKSGELLEVDTGLFGIFTIRRSADFGKTWEVEYSNFARRAYDAQKK